MGGGGVIRAAAKVAGYSAFRGFAPDHPVYAAARTAVRPVSVPTVSSVSDDVVGRVLSAPVQKPCSEFDDWEFAEAEENPPPRFVFGGAPTLQEAKEATSDLRETIDNVFLSPANHFGSSHDLETKSCDGTEVSVCTPSAPIYATRAFRLLHESTAAQSVVASIACDPNVWQAVWENPEVKKFVEEQKSSGDNLNGEECVEDNSSSFLASSESTSGFADFFNNIKVAIVDMMSNLSDYFQNVFGGYDVFPNADGSAKIGGGEKTIGASLMGLAVIVIMVIMLKRA